MFEGMMNGEDLYLDLHSLDETKDYYNVPSFNSIEDESDELELMPSQDENTETFKTNAAFEDESAEFQLTHSPDENIATCETNESFEDDSSAHCIGIGKKGELKDFAKPLGNRGGTVLHLQAIQARFYC